MATLHIFGKTDELDIPIMSVAQLKARIPVLPDSPSIYRLDAPDFAQITTIVYGDPDQEHATVTVMTDKPEPFKRVYGSFSIATQAFLLHSANAFR